VRAVPGQSDDGALGVTRPTTRLELVAFLHLHFKLASTVLATRFWLPNANSIVFLIKEPNENHRA
jgi:hypothetical protein